MRTGRTRTVAFAVAIATVVLAAMPVVATADPGSAHRDVRARGTGTDLLPDLVMARPYGWELQRRPSGKTWLRFGTIAWNFGDGPLEVRATRDDPSDDTMDVRQRIYQSTGGFRARDTSSVMIFDQADSHTHWHLRSFINVKLYRASDPAEYRSIKKLGYCLLDFHRHRDPPPNSPTRPVYPLDACGEPSSMSLIEGLSVGWGDDYPPHFSHQYINVTGLETGRYRMCLTVDPNSEFDELEEGNNQRWVDVRLDLATRRVVVKATGKDPCGPGVF